MSTSALEKLRNMPEWFTDRMFMRVNRLSAETTRTTLSRMKSGGLIESAGERSGVYFNLFKNPDAPNAHQVHALLSVYPSAVLVGESVLHNAGWITQIPSTITVAVLQRRSLQKLTGFSIQEKNVSWFKSMFPHFLSSDTANFTTYGLKAIPPEQALALLFQEGMAGLDIDDVDIPDEKQGCVAALFKERGIALDVNANRRDAFGAPLFR